MNGARAMNATRSIREICERNARMLALRPDRGHLSATTRARVEDGLRCSIREGEWTLAADMPVKAGGAGSAPTPGTLGRGALASCLAMGITMWAARLDVALDAVEVEVQADFDARGELGVGNVQAGYREVRVMVRIASPEPETRVAAVVEAAKRHSPYLDVFGRAQSMRCELEIDNRQETGEAA